MRRRLLVHGLLAVLATIGLLGCSGGNGAQAAGQLPEGFPDRFPIPEQAEVLSTGDAVILRLPDGPEETANYYERALPAAGWQVTDRWQGTDPHGEPTFGMVVEQAEAAGALSFTPTDEGGVIVRINLRQPTVTNYGP